MSDVTSVSILNSLIEISKDGEKGFRTSAEETRNGELKSVFVARADECAKAAATLQQLVTRLGGNPESGGSVAGAVHRGWVNVKSTVTGRSDVAILEECERGEDVAKAVYKKALESELPNDLRGIVQLQYNGVVKNHDQIRDLRNRYRSSQQP